MAFKMNRSIIKGTANHKASIAKAKAKTKSIVAQASTKADASLVEAARVLGQSYKPKEIDFTIDQPKIETPEIKELTAEEKADKRARKQLRKDNRKAKKYKKAEKTRIKSLQKEYESEHPEGTLFPDGKYYDASGKEIKSKKERRKFELGQRIGKFFRYTAGQIVDAAGYLISGTVNAAGQLVNEAGNIVGDVLEGVDTGLGKVTSDISKGIEGLEQTIEAERNRITEARDKRLEELRQQKLSKEAEERLAAKISAEYLKDIAIMNQQVREREGGIAVDEKLRSDEYSSFDEDPSKTLDNSKNPIDMRDDRIYRHAIKNGVVQRNMKKGGYIPPSER